MPDIEVQTLQSNDSSSPVMQGLQSHSKGEQIYIEYLPLSGFKDSSHPLRIHDKEQISHLEKSIAGFGFLIPILMDENKNIIAGHARVTAALRLGMTEVPAIRVSHLSEAQKKAFTIADNRISELAEWDDDALAKILSDLKIVALDFDIEATGFSLDEIDIRIETLNFLEDGEPDPDDQVEQTPAAAVVSVPGDIWVLNNHRIMQGDATKAEDLEKLMAGKRAGMSFTDPPYGVDYANSAKDKLRGTHRPILNDNLGEGFGPFLSAVCANILSVTDGAVYICMSSTALHLLQGAFAGAGGHFSTFIIWAKQAFTLGRADYQRQYEPILYGWRQGAARHWCGARDQGDVWFIDRPVKNDIHPTMKPVELIARAMRNSSQRGDIVLDPFLGSGSSLIAAERTGRVCYGMELDGKYVDAAIRRWQDHVGLDAVHLPTGKTFNEMARRAETHE